MGRRRRCLVGRCVYTGSVHEAGIAGSSPRRKRLSVAESLTTAASDILPATTMARVLSACGYHGMNLEDVAAKTGIAKSGSRGLRRDRVQVVRAGAGGRLGGLRRGAPSHSPVRTPAG